MNPELAEKSVRGLSELLLAPIYLISEIYGALIPGAVFVLLLFIKHEPLATSIFHVGFIGYKTKIFTCLFVSYVAGKVLGLPYRRVRRMVDPPNSRKAPESKRLLTGFLSGIMLSPSLNVKTRSLDIMILAVSEAQFYFGVGAAFAAGSLIGGDGRLRLIEAGIGLIMLYASTLKTKDVVRGSYLLLGMWTGEMLSKLSWDGISKLLKAVIKTQENMGEKPPDVSWEGLSRLLAAAAKAQEESIEQSGSSSGAKTDDDDKTGNTSPNH